MTDWNEVVSALGELRVALDQDHGEIPLVVEHAAEALVRGIKLRRRSIFDPLEEEVSLAKRGNLIAAVKSYRNRTGALLQDAAKLLRPFQIGCPTCRSPDRGQYGYVNYNKDQPGFKESCRDGWHDAR